MRCFECDWVQSGLFMRKVLEMKKVYSFISLEEARNKLKKDIFRGKKYAVLTFDDGYFSSFAVLKWLEDQRIPFTLFLNAKYMDGASCSKHVLDLARMGIPEMTEEELANGLYLTNKELYSLSSPMLSIASHGYEHVNASLLDSRGFMDDVKKNFSVLNSFFETIPFHAYTWGAHSPATDSVLKEMEIIPVLMDGEMNYNEAGSIHRETFPM